MFKSKKDVAIAIREKFQDKIYLGRTSNYRDGYLTFSHINSMSGIGCAMGCLMTPEQSDKFEEFAFNYSNGLMTDIFAQYNDYSTSDLNNDYGVVEQFLNMFDEVITLDDSI